MWGRRVGVGRPPCGDGAAGAPLRGGGESRRGGRGGRWRAALGQGEAGCPARGREGWAGRPSPAGAVSPAPPSAAVGLPGGGRATCEAPHADLTPLLYGGAPRLKPLGWPCCRGCVWSVGCAAASPLPFLGSGLAALSSPRAGQGRAGPGGSLRSPRAEAAAHLLR